MPIPKIVQFGRACSLIVGDPGGEAIELTDLRVEFHVKHLTYYSPGPLHCRITNPARGTVDQLRFFQAPSASPYDPTGPVVVLRAGYEGNFGEIFRGVVKQAEYGKLNTTDTFLELVAVDSDYLHAWAVTSCTLPAGYTQQDVWGACAASVAHVGITASVPPEPTRGPAPRGRAIHGMTRDVLQTYGLTNNVDVQADFNSIRAVPNRGYLKDEAVVINAETGMVGIPTITESGIRVTCLLNPLIRHGRRIKLNNKDIRQFLFKHVGINATAPRDAQMPQASLQADGFYKCVEVDHFGDTRGQAWYTELTALTIDPSATHPVNSYNDVPIPQ